jgi:hypothetical protein
VGLEEDATEGAIATGSREATSTFVGRATARTARGARARDLAGIAARAERVSEGAKAMAAIVGVARRGMRSAGGTRVEGRVVARAFYPSERLRSTNTGHVGGRSEPSDDRLFVPR